MKNKIQYIGLILTVFVFIFLGLISQGYSGQQLNISKDVDKSKEIKSKEIKSKEIKSNPAKSKSLKIDRKIKNFKKPGITKPDRIKKTNRKNPVITQPLIVKPLIIDPAVREKLPALEITRLRLDSQCRITGFFRNRGRKIDAGHPDFSKLEIKIEYTLDNQTSQVVLKTGKDPGNKQPRLLKSPSDRRGFAKGRPVRFSSALKVAGTKKNVAVILAQIDPDNKIKETPSGELKKMFKARVRSTCILKRIQDSSSKTTVVSAKKYSSAKKQIKTLDPETRQKMNIPVSAGNNIGNMVTRENDTDLAPHITIENVYLDTVTQTVHVVMKNTGGNTLDSANYPVTGLHLGVEGGAGSIWSFDQVDPEHTFFFTSLDFDTGITLPVYNTPVTIYFSAISGDRFESIPRSVALAMDMLSTPLPGEFVVIDRVIPAGASRWTNYRVWVNQPITISGSWFGNETGRVLITFPSAPAVSHTLSIQTWTKDRITGTITEAVRNSVGVDAGMGIAPVDAVLEVIPHGWTNGTEKEIGIHPDTSWYIPVIREHPLEIAPGQTYYIRGDYLYFGGTHRPEVRIITNTSMESCTMAGSGNGWIRFTVPDDLFLPGQRVEFELVNPVGRIAVAQTTFVAEEQRVITESFYKHKDLASIFCQYDSCCKDVAIYRERTSNAFSSKRLINNWKVESAMVEVTYCKCAEINNIDLPSRLCRANIISSPVPGSNNPETRIKVRFKPEQINYRAHVTIVGPSGLPHFE